MILYLDCDTGIDDALAIALLLAHDEVTLAGIGTVGGNTSAAQGAANTLGLLALAYPDDIPVAAGDLDPHRVAGNERRGAVRGDDRHGGQGGGKPGERRQGILEGREALRQVSRRRRSCRHRGPRRPDVRRADGRNPPVQDGAVSARRRAATVPPS